MAYNLIIFFTLLISLLVISLASKQGKKNKNRIKNVLLLILICQIILGFFNWENFSTGKSGFRLSLSHPNSLLGLLFVVTAIQILLLLKNKSLNTAVTLNFVNTVLIFIAMARLSTILGYQAVSPASMGTAFLILLGNIIGLIFINKDKYLQKKYPFKI